MKKWKLIRAITTVILIIFIVIVLWNFISDYTAKVKYPYPALGIDINNWFDRFCMNLGFLLYIGGIPMIIDIVFMIISIIKIKNLKKEVINNE